MSVNTKTLFGKTEFLNYSLHAHITKKDMFDNIFFLLTSLYLFLFTDL